MLGNTAICPKCNKELPLINEKGQHNFCPAVLEKSKTNSQSVIESICMQCKSKQEAKRRKKEKS